MKKEREELQSAICDKIQRCVHIIKIYKEEDMVKFLQDGLAREERMIMTDVLTIQFGINIYESKQLRDTLGFENDIHDLAKKMVEKFGTPLEITREEIHEIGQNI